MNEIASFTTCTEFSTTRVISRSETAGNRVRERGKDPFEAVKDVKKRFFLRLEIFLAVFLQIFARASACVKYGFCHVICQKRRPAKAVKIKTRNIRAAAIKISLYREKTFLLWILYYNNIINTFSSIPGIFQLLLFVIQ